MVCLIVCLFVCCYCCVLLLLQCHCKCLFIAVAISLVFVTKLRQLQISIPGHVRPSRNVVFVHLVHLTALHQKETVPLYVS